MSDLSLLIRQRGRVKAILTRIENLLTTMDLSKVTIHELSARLENLQHAHSEFMRIQLLLDEATPDDQANTLEEEEAEFQERYVSIVTRIKVAMDGKLQILSPLQNDSTTCPTQVKPSVKLPPLKLPTFSGQYQDWQSFHDLFLGGVHKNSALNDAQKLQYLNSALEGEARNLIKSIAITNANYQEAWKILQERYDNKNVTVNNLLSSIVNQRQIKGENANELRRLLDNVVEKVRSLEVLGVPVKFWDAILVFHVVDKLDHESRKLWGMKLQKNSLPTFDELKDFLDSRCNALEGLHHHTKLTTGNSYSTNTRHQARSTSSHLVSANNNCPSCNDLHAIYKCPVFKAEPVAQRLNTVKEKKLCFNCLRTGHNSRECKSSSCQICKKRHHTLLHAEQEQSSSDTMQPVSREEIAVVSHHIVNSQAHQVLLATALITIEDCGGTPVTCRALLDQGSESTFIDEDCVNRLGLKRASCKVPVNGIGSTKAGIVRGKVQLDITSRLSSFKIQASALIIGRITGIIPKLPANPSAWPHLQNLSLADPHFHHPSKIDVLIGADIFHRLLTNGHIATNDNAPGAFNTVFGWVITGPTSGADSRSVNVHFSSVGLDNTLNKFWELEEVSHVTPVLSHDERACEEHFVQTHARNHEGRFCVRIPFKSNVVTLGESRKMAVSRLLQLERRLSQDHKLYQQYRDFMHEYETLGHMEIIPKEDQSQSSIQRSYLPHHYVVKESSSTSKCRVVFDGSAKTTTGVSLNDTMLIGPTIQDDIFTIVIRFRTHQIAMVADIAKMYRQVNVHQDDQDRQCIVWRYNSSEPIKDYHLTTVTYGTSAAPFLAIRSLKQLALDEEPKFPRAAKVVLSDFYVDDLMSGADDTASAITLQSEVTELLQLGGFELRKWSSNSPVVLEAAVNKNEDPHTLGATNGMTVKTLGIQWDPKTDQFSFLLSLPLKPKTATKRSILSDIAKIYDPLGFLAPIVIKAKIILQKLWLLGLPWDDPVPIDLAEEWQAFRNQLSIVNGIFIERWMQTFSYSSDIMLIGFSDASENAYAAVVYLRVKDNSSGVKISLVASKTRVAPVKQVSLPRLELCGAVLLSRLVRRIQMCLSLPNHSIHMFSDSTIVLAWLHGHPRRWKTFIANRVAEIQDHLPPELWHHVSSEDNPADCASRGLTPSSLTNHELWWKGPSWLLKDISTWPSKSHISLQTEEEQRPIIVHIMEHGSNDITQRFSTLTKLKRLSALCLRFSHNCKHKTSRLFGPLKTLELENALKVHIRHAQAEAFHKEMNCIHHKNKLPHKSKLLSLSPFIDEEGILRVGGRLRNASLAYSQKFPIILPKSHHLTDLIVADCHKAQLHAGPRLLLSTLQQRFWILSGRDVVRRHVHKCIKCICQRAQTTQQFMGDLPAYRISPKRAFSIVGVDYAGPITLKSRRGRGRIPTTKGYVALFVCMVTKAIHIELVSDQTTEACIAALRRFVSRRGRPSDIYSDCGTTFIGTNHELKKILQFIHSKEHQEDICKTCANEGIQWHFSPPKAPHFGGLWEAGVKSMKAHLHRVIGATMLTFEEMCTLLTQVEACLNSRPLSALSADPSDVTALTPGHFLIGEPLNSIPDRCIDNSNINPLQRWQLIQRLVKEIWKHWVREYLMQLQQRTKWQSPNPNFNVGDLAILKDDSMLTPTKWKLCRIQAVHPGSDGIVRVVTVKTTSGTYKRPVVKLCPLPQNTDTSSHTQPNPLCPVT